MTRAFPVFERVPARDIPFVGGIVGRFRSNLWVTGGAGSYGLLSAFNNNRPRMGVFHGDWMEQGRLKEYAKDLLD